MKANMDVIRYCFSSSLIVLLASCASLSEQVLQRPEDWEQRLQHNQKINDWTIKARLGVQTEHEGGSFDVFWQQLTDAYDIRLIAPLGQGAVQITGDNDGVTISLANGQSEYSDDAEALFASMTGMSLPVAGLQDWLRGMPIEGEEIQHASWNEQGQLYKLEQSGWRIEMNRYKTVADFDLPHAFYLERQDRPELSVRLLIREWRPVRSRTNVQ
jgi:outer membrane lipoprotein LolB